MRTGGRLIERYIIGAVTPYLLLSLLLLTTILFTQQISRFGELLLGTRVPLGTAAEMALAVLPNVLVFTLPMALLTGVLIGFSRMGSDSELTAMRAAGVGTWKLLHPTLLLGFLLTLVSLYANLNLVPESAKLLRRAGASAALFKLESPVEPRSFNTEIPGRVIYVRDGDKAQGIWERVFLYTETKDGSIQLVTARSGRVDSAGEQSELVLTDVALTTIPKSSEKGSAPYVTERLDQWRVALDVGRKAILERLKNEEIESKPSEMGWRALSQYAYSRTDTEGKEAKILLHKRLAMSLTPILFAFLGAALGLRIRKGGRSAGALISVAAMLAYYLITLSGEQMARAGTVPPLLGTWLASIVALFCGTIFLSSREKFSERIKNSLRSVRAGADRAPSRLSRKYRGRVRLLNFPSLMDLDVLRAATLSFALTLISLITIFLIFTLFELWRFIVTRGIAPQVVGEYLIFLTPMVSVQLLPSSVLIAVIATYALISRRSESVAWWASGQSVYRLILPGLFFSAIVAALLWFVQEWIMPQSNIRQDTLRAQIRGGESRATVGLDRQWLASPESNRLYSYEYEEPGRLINPVIYDLDGDGIHLQRVVRGQFALWSGGELEIHEAETVTFDQESIGLTERASIKLPNAEPSYMFRPSTDKPAHLSANALSDYIKTGGRRKEGMPAMVIALHKKYASPFSVLVMALTGIPLALSFGRKSAIIALCLAIVLGLLFWAVTGMFQQLGEYELLPPLIAAWSPLVIFSALGLYLLTRART